MKWNKTELEKLKIDIAKTFGNYPLSKEEIIKVEETLDVKFPPLFRELNFVCSYEYSNLFSFFNFGGHGVNSVISSTLGIRERYNKAQHNVVLYLDDGGIILLDTSDINARVIWCSIYDLESYLEGQLLKHDFNMFETFADFFKFLLDEEEKSREGN